MQGNLFIAYNRSGHYKIRRGVTLRGGTSYKFRTPQVIVNPPADPDIPEEMRGS
jgi:hypothetical protein